MFNALTLPCEVILLEYISRIISSLDPRSDDLRLRLSRREGRNRFQIRKYPAVVPRIHHRLLAGTSQIGCIRLISILAIGISVKERKYHARLAAFPVKSVVRSRRGQEPACNRCCVKPTSMLRIWRMRMKSVGEPVTGRPRHPARPNDSFPVRKPSRSV